MEFELIAATTPSGCIGNKGRIPWRVKEDLMRFKAITSTTESKNEKNIVIMGRKTYESIPRCRRPLADRTNIVVTSQPESVRELYTPRENLLFASSLDQAVEKAYSLDNKGTVFIVGGVRLYRESIVDKRCKRLYLTVVRRPVQCDSIVPEFREIIQNRMNGSYKTVRSRNGLEDVEYHIYERVEHL